MQEEKKMMKNSEINGEKTCKIGEKMGEIVGKW